VARGHEEGRGVTAGHRASAKGTVIVIEDDQVWVGKGDYAEFKGLVRIPKPGTLQIVVGGEVAIEMPYSLKGDKLTLTSWNSASSTSTSRPKGKSRNTSLRTTRLRNVLSGT